MKKEPVFFCQLYVFFVKKKSLLGNFFPCWKSSVFIFQVDFHYMVEYFLVWTFIIFVTTAMIKQQIISILSTFTKHSNFFYCYCHTKTNCLLQTFFILTWKIFFICKGSCLKTKKNYWELYTYEKHFSSWDILHLYIFWLFFENLFWVEKNL